MMTYIRNTIRVLPNIHQCNDDLNMFGSKLVKNNVCVISVSVVMLGVYSANIASFADY